MLGLGCCDWLVRFRFLGVGYAVEVGSDLIWLVLDLLSLVWWYFVVCGFGVCGLRGLVWVWMLFGDFVRVVFC